jgi:hypothetical protein
MTNRTSPKDAASITEAADLDEIVVDKREVWRASGAKARRRQRRYKQLLTRELTKRFRSNGDAILDEDDALTTLE